MPRGKSRSSGLLHAFDEAAFGSERTLNLRESLPSAAEARLRAEVWLKARQMTHSGEVLVITGRGNQSVGGVGIVRQEILAMLPALRRRGIVDSWREHSPGSLVIKLAPLSALFTAPKRRRDESDTTKRRDTPAVLAGLDEGTMSLLRQLAIANLESLGIVETEQFIEQEMVRAFSALVHAIPEGAEKEAALHAAIRKAIDETSEHI